MCCGEEEGGADAVVGLDVGWEDGHFWVGGGCRRWVFVEAHGRGVDFEVGKI